MLYLGRSKDSERVSDHQKLISKRINYLMPLSCSNSQVLEAKYLGEMWRVLLNED